METTEKRLKLKVNPKDNTITIRKVKTTYSQQEVDDMLSQQAAATASQILEKFEGYKSKEEIIELIKLFADHCEQDDELICYEGRDSLGNKILKNLYLIPTEKKIKNVGDLVKDQYGEIHIFTKNDGKEYGKTTAKLNIYITFNETPKVDDWVYNIVSKTMFKATKQLVDLINNPNITLTTNKKIILTTDQDLIKDGVQAIDDEFLEWFVKNPSCEYVDIFETYNQEKNACSNKCKWGCHSFFECENVS